MRAPLNWLRDFVKIDIPAEKLAEKLVSAGFEVDEIIREADCVRNVVAGRILRIDDHPDSDHLLVCRVNVGSRTIGVITGAHNVKVGDVVPVALDGAKLFDGKIIRAGTIRGVASEGMMCGGSEIGVTEEDYEGASADGIMILKPDVHVGTDINDVLGRNDEILEIEVTANRPDCNSIWGIAREIGAVLHRPVKDPYTRYTAVPERVSNILTVQIADSELCPRYIAKAIKDVRIEESPKIIKDRLRAAGLKPINNIIDVTNYILVELGQPMHAFDYDKLAGGAIIVRRAEAGERITTLDGVERALDKDVLVIADKEKPIAIAGVMGGMDSAISADTKTVIFESARFDRASVRRTSRRLNLRSDSSARFEKGVDFMSQEIAVNRALNIVQLNGWGTVISGILDSNVNADRSRDLTVPYKKINNILGIKVAPDKMKSVLNSLGIETEIKGKNLLCSIPPWREDILGANDLAEEIIRLHGYGKIKSTLFETADQTSGGRPSRLVKENGVKRLLAAEGAREIITYSFISPKSFDTLRLPEDDPKRVTVKILNPLGEDVGVMRTTLVPSMLSVMGGNCARNNREGFLFETAAVYVPKTLPLSDFPSEIRTLCVGTFGQGDFFSLKGVLGSVLQYLKIDSPVYERADIGYLHPGRSATVSAGGVVLGYVGEVHPDVSEAYGIPSRAYVAELNMDALFKASPEFRGFRPLPKYPAVSRDLALLLKDDRVNADQVTAVIKKVTDRELLESVKIFDVYKGQGIPEGYTGIALTVVFRAKDRTLKDSEVQAEIDHALKSLLRKYRVRLRA